MSHLKKVDHITYACGKGRIEQWAWFHIEIEGGTLINRIDDVRPEDPDSSMKIWCIDFGEFGIALIEGIRSVRGEMNVPASLKAPLVRVELDDAGAAAWDNNAALITRMARLGEVTEGAAPKGSATIAVPGGSFALPLADIIDVAAEKARLAKTLEKLDKDLRGLTGRLKNPKFIESAPDEVVEETRALAAEKEAERARIAAALERLAEVG